MPRVSNTRRTSRAATHSGSWYSNNASTLSEQIQTWMAEASAQQPPRAGTQATKAIIAPHAGYAYSGRTMAFAYSHLPDPASVKRIFILGPLHHVYSDKCHLSGCARVETPLGNLTVDTATVKELVDAHPELMATLDIGDDEEEHSVEMHLPYVAHYIKSGLGSSEEGGHLVVPMMVGALSPAREQRVGEILAPYLMDPATIFIISSDFCHWGRRFGFQYHDVDRFESIHEGIAWLDSEGMKAIEAKKSDGFVEYLIKYSNTICGRHPIGVLLCALEHGHGGDISKYDIGFTKYDRSSLVEDMSDSSVSYCSAVVRCVHE